MSRDTGASARRHHKAARGLWRHCTRGVLRQLLLNGRRMSRNYKESQEHTKHGQKTPQLSGRHHTSLSTVTSSEKRTRGITTRKEAEQKASRREDDREHEESRRGEKTTPGFTMGSRRDDEHEESRRGDTTNSNTKYQGNAKKISKRGIATGVG